MTAVPTIDSGEQGYVFSFILRDSEIDLGTKAKPNIKKVSEWVEIATIEAGKINHELNMALLKLNEMYKVEQL